jgi:hypothetical protein
MLVGPALIGGLAEAVGLPAALASVVVLTGTTALLAGAIGPPVHHPDRSQTGAVLEVPT